MFSRSIISHVRPSPIKILKVTCGRHQPHCPASKATKGVCAAASGGKDTGTKLPAIKRGPPGKVVHGFIPMEWMEFFYPKTGVSGPYLFMLTVGNYLVSKEMFVMEHEYYSGLSWVLIIYLASTKMGPGAGKALDEQVDAVCKEFENTRKGSIDHFEGAIKMANDGKYRAEGQKLLMDAKKENVLMQLEAIYRERCVYAYKAVKGRLDYHSKKYFSEARIHQKWMIGWILENVRKSITPDFEKAAFDKCIQDLTSLASK